LSDTGAVFAYGKNKDGELGVDDTNPRDTPTRVTDLPANIVQVSAGHNHSAALTCDGHVYTWGFGGTFWSGCGGLGHGDSADLSTPKRVEALSDMNIRSVVCGKYQTFAITADGQVYTWGRGEYGRLGLGDSGDYKSPQLLDALAHKQVAKIATVGAACAAVTHDGELYTWGRNEFGQLGVLGGVSMDVYAMEPAPALVDTLQDHKVVDVAVGERHMTCVTDDGRLYLWGNRAWPSPYLLEGDEGSLANIHFTNVVAGNKFSAAIDRDNGSMFTWGSGRSYCLGHGDGENHTHPIPIVGMSGVVSMSAGGNNIAAFVK
jgi:E3 ubiquitin-protein ligase HERC2